MHEMIIQSVLTVALLSVFSTSAARGQEPAKGQSEVAFVPVLSDKNLTCAKPTYCRISEPDDQIYLVWFDSSVDTEENLREIQKVNIKNSETGETQTFKVEDVARVELDEPVRFYKAELRKGGPTDLVLYSLNSLKDGELFYYFIFNPKTKKFVLSKDQVPKLKRSADGKNFVSDENPDIIYNLDSDLRLKLNVPASKAAIKKSERDTN